MTILTAMWSALIYPKVRGSAKEECDTNIRRIGCRIGDRRHHANGACRRGQSLPFDA